MLSTLAALALLLQSIQGVSPEEAADLIAQDEVVILDVRTPEEFASGHIPGAQLLNVNDPSFRERASQLDPDQAYLVQCRSGRRSARAAQILQELGVDTIYDLEGGILAWDDANLPITAEHEETPQ